MLEVDVSMAGVDHCLDLFHCVAEWERQDAESLQHRDCRLYRRLSELMSQLHQYDARHPLFHTRLSAIANGIQERADDFHLRL